MPPYLDILRQVACYSEMTFWSHTNLGENPLLPVNILINILVFIASPGGMIIPCRIDGLAVMKSRI